MLAALHRHHPDIALSAWPAKHDELDRWLTTGLIDAALTYNPIMRDQLSNRELRSEQLLLVSTRPDSPSRFDPGYVYVDAGADFGRRHAAAYADAGIARVSFGCSVWALDFLLQRGGSAYLPEHIAAPGLAAGELYRIADAPVFTRQIYLISNDRVAEGWPWFAELEQWLADAS